LPDPQSFPSAAARSSPPSRLSLDGRQERDDRGNDPRCHRPSDRLVLPFSWKPPTGDADRHCGGRRDGDGYAVRRFLDYRTPRPRPRTSAVKTNSRPRAAVLSSGRRFEPYSTNSGSFREGCGGASSNRKVSLPSLTCTWTTPPLTSLPKR